MGGNLLHSETIYTFAAWAGRFHGCDRIIGLGGWDIPVLASLSALGFDLVAVDFGLSQEPRPDCYGGLRWVDAQSFLRSAEGSEWSRAVVVCMDALEPAADPAPVCEVLRHITRIAPLTIVGTTPARLIELATQGAVPTFAGTLRNDPNDLTIALFDPSAPKIGQHPPVPEGFKVVALVTAYNEGDIIRPVLEHLVSQGVSPYLIDNWSTDDTVSQACAVPGLLGYERFPSQGPSQFFALQRLLTRVEELAGQIPADWYIHVDADEVRLSPWEHLNLREALYAVDEAGFNVVDHTCLGFHPVDDGWMPGMSLDRHFRFYDYGAIPMHYVQRKAWKRIDGLRPELAASGGHDVSFPGRRVYPYKFLTKHYPIRSQQHGERKIFQERVARYDPRERVTLGWHNQYEIYQRGCSFLRAPDGLMEWSGCSYSGQLIERLSGIGAGQERFLLLPRPVRSPELKSTLEAGGCRFNLETCNEVREPLHAQPVRIARKARAIELSGWAIDLDSKGPAHGVEIAVDSRVYPTLYGSPRQDVSEYFGNATFLHCGFTAKIALSTLEGTGHSVSLRILLDPGDTYLESPPLQINISDL
ncbi:MAG: hypothetical protein C5B51_08070 [Terriglobia bacterium]|nr:MAG: hypothetical protein C5B51_08070 [Terriglobia bacterium]